MVMAYIIFVNPAILSFTGIPALQGQGPPFAATQAATCLVAGLMTIAMGLAANYPLALASGMGLNAAVALQLVAGMTLPWQAPMGVDGRSRFPPARAGRDPGAPSRLARLLEPGRRVGLFRLCPRGGSDRDCHDLLHHAIGLLRHHGHGDRGGGRGGMAHSRGQASPP